MEGERRRQPRLRALEPVSRSIEMLWSLAEHAFTSHISKLLNKSAFNEFVRVSPETGESFVVAFADLSGFKQVNDQYGHSVGDLMLAEVGRALFTLANECAATAFHLSGDEFALLFDMKGWVPEHLTRLNARSGPISIKIQGGGPTDEVREVTSELFFGIAMPEAAVPLDELLARAESAAKVAKDLASKAPIEWNPGIKDEALDDPRKRCSKCGATTRVLVPRKRKQEGVPVACGNCGERFAVTNAA